MRLLTSFVVVVCLACSAAGGCALAVTGPDPDRPRTDVPRCDTGKGLVVLDGLWATVLGVSALAVAGEDEGGTALSLAGIGALFVASAVRGNNQANECRAAFTDYDTAMRAHERDEMLARSRPRPAVKVKPREREPAPEPEPEPAPPAAGDEPAPTGEEPAATYATPRPPRTPAPKPAPPPPPSGDDWSSFWKEVP